MATERLVVKNFGPIREAELDLKKVTVFIGEQASGKSVLAKLSALFRRHDILTKENRGKWWKDEFMYFALDGFESDSSNIEFLSDDYSVSFTNPKMTFNVPKSRLKDLIQKIKKLEKRQDTIEDESKIAFEKEDYLLASTLESEKSQNSVELIKLKIELKSSFLNSEYIPAERTLISFIKCRHFEGLYFDDFIDRFEEKRKLKKKIHLYPLDIEYYYNENEEESDSNMIKINKETFFPMYKAASGIQSLAPLQVILETINPRHKYLFVIEEPELNLFPSTQKKLVDYLIEKCTKGDNRLIITTHSPYILTSLNNLIQAKNVVKKSPELADEVAKIVPPQYHLDFEDIAVYYVADGTARSILNIENQLIDASALDAISEEIGEDFGKLIQLEFQNEPA